MTRYQNVCIRCNRVDMIKAASSQVCDECEARINAREHRRADKRNKSSKRKQLGKINSRIPASH